MGRSRGVGVTLGVAPIVGVAVGVGGGVIVGVEVALSVADGVGEGVIALMALGSHWELEIQ